MARKSGSSRRWLDEHFSDEYVKEAQKLGYRSRATFKLIEIQEKDNIIKPGMTVVDLGAAPGGWSQILTKWVGRKGQVIALDILPMDPIESVEFIQGDFTQDDVLDTLNSTLGGREVDWVVSDMAPNASGNKYIDIPRAMHLVDLALDFALSVLKPEGGLVIKVFQGDGFDSLLKTLKASFNRVVIRKPKASRSRSKEVYFVAQGLKG